MGQLVPGRTVAGELSDFPHTAHSVKVMAEEIESEMEFRNRQRMRRAKEASA